MLSVWIGALTLLFQGTPAPSLDIHFVPTPSVVIDAMLTGAGVNANDIVYDLGSGDGRIVISAAQKFGARGVGIELDPKLIKAATERARKAGVADRVRFVQADLFKADISEATVVTLYLSSSTNFRLEPKLKRELKPGTRIVSHRFDMRGWPPQREVAVGGTHVLFWTIPERDTAR